MLCHVGVASITCRGVLQPVAAGRPEQAQSAPCRGAPWRAGRSHGTCPPKTPSSSAYVHGQVSMHMHTHTHKQATQSREARNMKSHKETPRRKTYIHASPHTCTHRHADRHTQARKEAHTYANLSSDHQGLQRSLQVCTVIQDVHELAIGSERTGWGGGEERREERRRGEGEEGGEDGRREERRGEGEKGGEEE